MNTSDDNSVKTPAESSAEKPAKTPAQILEEVAREIAAGPEPDPELIQLNHPGSARFYSDVVITDNDGGEEEES
jgi:hypothetical protein